MPWVRIKEGARHRLNDGAEVFGGAVVEVSEAEVVSFGDKFESLEVKEPSKSTLEILATKAAREYAEEHGISLSLSSIQGTGKEGRITLADVKVALQVDEDGDS
jgi:pyruvate/2-oxoglutarate dehydrogenase complex dihydrolipoamide acyltransferase (E2) component